MPSRREFLKGGAAAAAGALATSLDAAFARPRAPCRPSPTRAPSSLAKLRGGVAGQVLLAGEAEYDAVLAGFGARPGQRPAMIVRCAGADDVARSLEFARLRDLEIAVRSGGHDVLGESVCERGMVIDLSPMKKVSLDPVGRIARCEAGLRSGDVDRATQPHGLAVPLGCNPVVGIGGLTLGGGLGWFLGKHGATCDNLLSADIVTADARVVRAAPDENPDLFWAIRGGGGNFGIATTLEYQMHPAGMVLGGFVSYRGAQMGELLRFYREYMRDAPDELTVELTIFGGEEPYVVAFACYAGNPSMGERALAPLRSFGPPMADSIGAVEYARLTERPGLAFGLRTLGPTGIWRMLTAPKPRFGHWRAGSVESLDDRAVETLVEQIAFSPPGSSIGVGHYMHGAFCRGEPGATCLPRPCGGLCYFMSASWSDADRSQSATGWVERAWGAMLPQAAQRTYVNYLSVGSPSAVAAAYGESFARLAALKKRWDPANVFHLNRNIRPASEAAFRRGLDVRSAKRSRA